MTYTDAPPNSQKSQSATPSSLYFVNPVVDFLCIGGVSIVLYVLFRLLPGMSTSPTVATVTLAAVWIINYPHFASTNQRLYGWPANLRQYPLTAFVIPVLVLAAVVACYLSPEAIAPQFVLLYFLWSPFHYSGQTTGITLVYARRAGIRMTNLERRSLGGVSLLTFAVRITRGAGHTTTSPYFGINYLYPAIPPWVPTVLQVALAGSSLILLGSLGRRVFFRNQRIPWIVLLPITAQYIWLLGITAGNFLLMVPLFHALQYLLIAWGVQLKERLDSTRRTPSGRFVLGETLRWAAVNISLGGILFWALPHLGGWFGKPLAFSTAILFVAIQIHHFFVDGVIWKLRHPKVTSPLSATLGDLTGSNHSTAVAAGAAT